LAGSVDDRIELEGTGGWRGVGDQDVVMEKKAVHPIPLAIYN
jgi:hypothetical protein